MITPDAAHPLLVRPDSAHVIATPCPFLLVRGQGRLRHRPAPQTPPVNAIGLLDRSRSVAPLDYDRWRVPPAALAIHLAIGQAYAFSVFNLPLSRLIGITGSAAGDWDLTTIGWIFSVAIVFLGLSAFTLGRWVEDVGPRKAMFTSAVCFAGGFLIAALGVRLHQIWIVYLGYGVVGGIGLGIGYIAPITTLIKWFPDRPGMATGLAVMGFGGGAMIGSPLAVTLMDRFSTTTATGVAATFVAMGVIYFAFMMFGVFTVRLPAPGWTPASYTSRLTRIGSTVPSVPRVGTPAGRSNAERRPVAKDVHVDVAIRTPQFWLLWAMLCANLTVGMGLLGQASSMIQDMFPGVIRAGAAAGFVGLLSMADMLGRLAWSSASDGYGRRRTYAVCLALGATLCAAVPASGPAGNLMLFVIFSAIIVSISSGGLAAIPAYVRDLYGNMHVGAIHGRLLTAWSVAAVAGPALVNYVHEYQVANSVARADAYSTTMYLMAGLLAVGLAANWRVRSVDPRHHHQHGDAHSATDDGVPA